MTAVYASGLQRSLMERGLSAGRIAEVNASKLKLSRIMAKENR